MGGRFLRQLLIEEKPSALSLLFRRFPTTKRDWIFNISLSCERIGQHLFVAPSHHCW